MKKCHYILEKSVTFFLHFFRIVVTTVVTAGHLVTYGVARGHFSHIFIDESGQAHEPEAIIPIAGLAHPGTTKYVVVRNFPAEFHATSILPALETRGVKC